MAKKIFCSASALFVAVGIAAMFGEVRVSMSVNIYQEIATWCGQFCALMVALYIVTDIWEQK